jgi:thymidylate synthase ThyX
MIEAKVICDSISPEGIRLTTMKLRYPKFIHGEFLTHRVFSRNASSSRAIPVAKSIEEVRSDALRAAPVFWGKNQPGMQAVEEITNEERGPHGWYNTKATCEHGWRGAAIAAADNAEYLLSFGLHKQIVNRILEPFLHINVVVTATEWDNFFGLRLDKAAQPEMHALAVAMWEARSMVIPKPLAHNQWHLPFVVPSDAYQPSVSEKTNEALEMCIKISVARCARVSYESHETGRRSTVEEDLVLYDRLLASKHLSPFEHQATPDEITGPYDITFPAELTEEQKKNCKMPMTIVARFANPEQHGNFRGWRQYRKTIPNEATMPLPKEYVQC